MEKKTICAKKLSWRVFFHACLGRCACSAVGAEVDASHW